MPGGWLRRLERYLHTVEVGGSNPSPPTILTIILYHPNSKMNRMQALYAELKERYGKPGGQWSLWCKRPKTLEEKELIAIEAILTQRANWKNVQLAVANLKEADCLGLKKILAAEDRKLSWLVRPSGFYRQKAERLKILARFLL